MPTPLDGRRETYMDRYQRTLAAAYRVERIQRDIENEQARVQYLDSLIGQERQTEAALMEIFAVKEDFSESQRLLKERAELDTAIGLREAGRGAAARRAVSMSDAEREALTVAIGSGQKAAVKDTAEQMIRGATPEKARKIIGFLGARTGSRVVDADMIGGLTAFAGTQATGRLPGRGAGEAEAVEGAEEAFAESLESAYFSGPSGIRGGYDGLEIANLRELTATGLRERAAAAEPAMKERLEARADRLEASGFATGQEAYDAALAVVRGTGEVARIEDEFARDIYEEAREKKAYRNDERADFEQSVLDSRRRTAEMESERKRLQERITDNPAMEANRRELTARGYKFYDRDSPEAWKNAYAQYQMTPDYAVYLGAYEKYNTAITEEVPIAPSSRAENIVTSYTMMLTRRGMEISIPVLRKQLDKAGIKGRDQNEAISFAMAYWQAGGPEQDPAQLRLQREDAKRRQEEQEMAQEREASARREVELQRDITADMEQQEMTAVGDLRLEQERSNDVANLYMRLRLTMGPEEARAEALRQTEASRAVPIDTASPASRIMMQPDAILARNRAADIERERRADARLEDEAAQEITFKPGVVGLGDDAVDLTPEPAQPVAPERPAQTSSGRTIIYDPDGVNSYIKTPSGTSYLILKNGIPTGSAARQGSRAFRSIAEVEAGRAPLAPARRAPAAPAAPPATPAPAAPAPAAAPETAAERRARLEAEMEARRTAQ